MLLGIVLLFLLFLTIATRLTHTHYSFLCVWDWVRGDETGGYYGKEIFFLDPPCHHSVAGRDLLSFCAINNNLIFLLFVHQSLFTQINKH